MPAIPRRIRRPEEVWHGVQFLAAQEGDTTTGILRAQEEYVTTAQKRRRRQRPGKAQQLVKARSLPGADLHLSARPAAALRTLNLRYGYERVSKSPADLCQRPNFGVDGGQDAGR